MAYLAVCILVKIESAPLFYGAIFHKKKSETGGSTLNVFTTDSFAHNQMYWMCLIFQSCKFKSKSQRFVYVKYQFQYIAVLLKLFLLS